MTQVIDTVAGFRKALDAERHDGKTVGLVPTMGALHAGHASLIDAAAATCDVVAVTVFVNPLQFGPNEDLAKYPRPFEADVALAQAHGAHYIFHPSVDEMYGTTPVLTTVHVAQVTDGMEGAVRPGHFDGVSTVVAKLFNAAGLSKAFFGEKDYQQLQVVTQMVKDLSFPIEIVPCPIIRETDGLALSSRNRFLQAAERAEAPRLAAELNRVRDAVLAGNRDFAAIERDAMAALAARGWQPDYVAVRKRVNLLPPAAQDGDAPLVVLAAAKLGTTRLIDNLEI